MYFFRVIKTLGQGLTHIKPVQGFCAETAGALTILGSTFAGLGYFFVSHFMK